MDSVASDPTLLIGPFLIFMLPLVAIAWIGILGGSLKFSLSLVMDDAPSFLKCLLGALLIIVVNIAVFAGIYFTLGPQPWYIGTCYQALFQMLLVMVLARCNPFAAFFAALCHGVFSSIGTIALFLVLFFTCGSAVSNAMERKKKTVRKNGPTEVLNPYAQ
jgi:hypothetical protein